MKIGYYLEREEPHPWGALNIIDMNSSGRAREDIQRVISVAKRIKKPNPQIAMKPITYFQDLVTFTKEWNNWNQI